MNKTFSFIGSGNMAYAIVGGLVNPSSSLSVLKKQITLFDSNADQYTKFGDGFAKAASIAEAMEADIIVLAVKPQNYPEVLAEINGIDLSGKILISIAAGISTDYIESKVGKCAVVRTMPNTPLLIGKGVTALCCNENVTDEDFAFVEKIFASSGTTIRLEESDMNKICAVTGSSPAYIFLMIQAICEGAEKQGIRCEDLRAAVCNMVIGSATLALESDKSLEELIRMVTSPKGTTEQALRVFHATGFTKTVTDAMDACTKRADELALH